MAAKRTERQRDAERKRAARRTERDLRIPRIANPSRRRRCEQDIFKWLRTYFPESFYHEFTQQQRQMVEAILTAAKYGGDQAIAAPRSDGKTTIAECVILFCVLTGLLKFPLIVAATGPDAARILDHIKGHLERNELLAADYPEVCFPICALEGAPQRAGSQTVKGKRTWLEWRQDHVVLPTVGKSRASGAVLMTRGLDAAIRGIRVGATRPDFVLIDDPETRESVKSEEQTKTRRLTIEEDLAGLGGGDKKLSRVMLTTIMRRTTNEGGPTLSCEYTDPTKKPSWQGRRFQLLEAWPVRHDLWDEYVSLRQADQQAGDRHACRATQFYAEHREAMDDGAQVGNPSRYSRAVRPDGQPAELSALQRCWNIIADRGLEAFQTEYQNDPPEQSGPQESGITAHRIQKQVSGYPRKLIPPGCVLLTQGIDVQKTVLYWVVRAWRPDCTGYVIDYGVQDVHGTIRGSDEGVELAIINALRERAAQMDAEPYADAGGEIKDVSLSLVDSRYKTEAAFHFCRQIGLGWMPAMGFGRSAGCVAAHYSPPLRATQDKKPGGEGWHLVRKPNRLWCVYAFADYWKSWEHARWLTDPRKPGSLLLFGEPSERSDRLSDDEKRHHAYAKHITAEIEVEEVVRGVLTRKWKAKSDSNHWGDASYLANVAAAMRGIVLLKAAPPAPVVVDTRPVTDSLDYLQDEFSAR